MSTGTRVRCEWVEQLSTHIIVPADPLGESISVTYPLLSSPMPRRVTTVNFVWQSSGWTFFLLEMTIDSLSRCREGSQLMNEIAEADIVRKIGGEEVTSSRHSPYP